jgi:4-amino-4-deoxy-L-arabinose transferase-like glycosyltransferase
MSEIMQTIWHKHRGILLILVLFLIIGLGYNLTIPLFEAPAEGSHFRYVRHIAEGRGLPLIPPDVQFPQEHQAPLYYLLTAALISPLDLSGPSLPQPNPYHAYNNPGPIEDNRNSYYHTRDEAFPYRGLVLAVHIGRLVALTMGALTVLATYAIAYEVLEGCEVLSSLSSPSQPEKPSFWTHRTIALGAAAINAFNPQFVFIANVMSNDTTASAFSGWSLFFALRILRRGISWRRSLLLGVTVGLAAMSKLNGLAMLPIAMLALAIVGLQQRDIRLWLKHTLFVGALVLLIAGWWYVRNWLLYRDPFTLKLAAERWGTGGETQSFGEIVAYWREIEVGFWGLFGHDNLLMDPFVYDVLHIVELLAVAGLIIWGIRAWYHYARRGSGRASAGRASPPTLPYPPSLSSWAGLGLVALSFLAALAGLYRWLQVTDLPAGRYLYPAMSSISMLLFLGLSGLVPHRLTSILAGGVGIGLLTLTLVTPFRYIAPAYTTPPLLTGDEAVPNQVGISYRGGAHPADGTPSHAGHIRLVGYEIQEETIQPGDWLHVTLYWQTLEQLDKDLTVALRVFGRDGAIVGSKDTFPGLGRYPTSLWQPDLIIKDTYPIQIAFDAKTPTHLSFDVTLYHQPTMFVVPKLDQAGNEIGQLTLGEAKLISSSPRPIAIPSSPEGKLAGETYFTLGNEVRLVGYSLSEAGPYLPGSSIELTLYWQPLTNVSADYTVFIHLLDEEGQVIAGWDAPPANGDYPTHLWSAEEMVEDTHPLTLPPDLLPGDYQLVVGLYQLDTLQRLPVFNAEGQRTRDDAIPLLTWPMREP